MDWKKRQREQKTKDEKRIGHRHEAGRSEQASSAVERRWPKSAPSPTTCDLRGAHAIRRDLLCILDRE